MCVCVYVCMCLCVSSRKKSRRINRATEHTGDGLVNRYPRFRRIVARLGIISTPLNYYAHLYLAKCIQTRTKHAVRNIYGDMSDSTWGERQTPLARYDVIFSSFGNWIARDEGWMEEVEEELKAMGRQSVHWEYTLLFPLFRFSIDTCIRVRVNKTSAREPKSVIFYRERHSTCSGWQQLAGFASRNIYGNNPDLVETVTYLTVCMYAYVYLTYVRFV